MYVDGLLPLRSGRCEHANDLLAPRRIAWHAWIPLQTQALTSAIQQVTLATPCPVYACIVQSAPMYMEGDPAPRFCFGRFFPNTAGDVGLMNDLLKDLEDPETLKEVEKLMKVSGREVVATTVVPALRTPMFFFSSVLRAEKCQYRYPPLLFCISVWSTCFLRFVLSSKRGFDLR